LWRNLKYRVFVGSFVAMTAVAWLFYLSFRASTPGSLKYGELHYFKMFWPGIVLFAAALFDNLLRPILANVTTKSATKKRKAA
jgi:hypothetical protein